MAKVKEVWVRFSDTETYYEKEGELLSILANASGDCVVKVYIENIRSCKELHDMSFDKEQLSLLTDAFGEENVRYQEREIKTEIKWSRPTEVPKIKQLLPCRHDILLSSELDAPAPCRLNAPDLDFACRTSADCLHQHQQVI